MMDVAVWLRGLGLEQYEALFRENDIDAEVLSDLTDGDLEKIGVSLGHRKRLLKAIASTRWSRSRPQSPRAAAAPIPTGGRRRRAPPRSPSCFCDLVGSTSLAARLDAEDWRNLVAAYLDAASRPRSRALGGHVLKKARRRV